MNPKNEPLRLSVTAARERDNPRGRVESIRAGMKTLADRIHAEQRHKPGWTPAPDYRVVAKADTYKGRDYEALLKAALKPPVGYWEDAPTGMKFGGAGGQNTVPVEAQKPDAAPSSDGSILPQARAPQGLKVRAWRGAGCDWVVVGGRYYVGPVREWRGGQWERSNCDDSPMPKGWPELPAPEALELWKACATALRLNCETGDAQSATVALDGSRAGKED